MKRENGLVKSSIKATFVLAAALLLGVGAAQAQTTFYNAATTTANPQTDSEHYLQLVTVAGAAGSSYTLSQFQLGVNYADALQNAGVIVEFYTGVDTSNTSTNVLANATLLTSANGTLATPGATGNYTYTFTLNTPISLGTISTIGVDIYLTTEDFSSYANGILNGRFTASAPTVGSSPGYVWNDANLDNTFTGAEKTNFGLAQANIRFSMTGTVAAVPEPSTYAICAMSLLAGGFVWMRRRNTITA